MKALKKSQVDPDATKKGSVEKIIAGKKITLTFTNALGLLTVSIEAQG